MNEIGIKELQTRASEIVRAVREEQTQYVVTHRGRPAALLVPADGPVARLVGVMGAGDQAAWEELERLGEEIGRGWRSSETSADIISAMR